MLKASQMDIPIIDGYLHDSYFKPEDIVFNADQRCFTMDIERVCYEQGKRGKTLFFIPVIRYPWIRSRLSMNGVEKMHPKWIGRGVDGPGNRQLLMDIEHKSEDTIVLGSTYLKIALTVAPDFELTLMDAPEPENGPWTIDFFKGIFRGMDEIDRLRVKADAGGGPKKIYKNE